MRGCDKDRIQWHVAAPRLRSRRAWLEQNNGEAEVAFLVVQRRSLIVQRRSLVQRKMLDTPKKPSRAKSYSALSDSKLSDSDGQEKKPASLGRASGRRVRSAAREQHDEESGLPSREKKKESPSKSKAAGPFRPRMLTILAACTILFGPVGTVLTYMLMPKENAASVEAATIRHTGSASAGGHMRVLHLALAGTEVKARFVIDDRSTWETVTSGCKERLQIAGVERITDSSGEAIMSVHDLIHEGEPRTA